MISDVCPECGTDHLDVQATAFAKVGAGLAWLLLGRAAGEAGRQAGGQGTLLPPQLTALPALPSLLPPPPQMADPGLGRIQMRYRRVECAPPEDMKAGAGRRRGPGRGRRRGG